MAEAKLTKHEERLLASMKSGATLCCEVDGSEEGQRNDGRRWFLEPGGRVVGPKSAARLVSRGGLVVARDDGLFGAADAQTYVAAP